MIIYFCTGLSLSITNVWLEPALVVLMTARYPSAIVIRVLKRYRSRNQKTWNLHSTPGATKHGAVSKERASGRGPGVLPLLGVRPRVSASLFYDELQTRVEIYSRMGRENKQVVLMVSVLNQPRFLKRRSLSAGMWPALQSVAWTYVDCRQQSLEWILLNQIPRQSKPKSGTCTRKDRQRNKK